LVWLCFLTHFLAVIYVKFSWRFTDEAFILLVQRRCSIFPWFLLVVWILLWFIDFCFKRHKCMCAINDSVNNHDCNHRKQTNDHATRELVAWKLGCNTILLVRHIGVEHQDVETYNELYCTNPHIKVFSRFLLFY
jgi:hypothetical protein